MSTEASLDMPFELPQGYCAIPLHAACESLPLRLCVLVREQSEELGGRLVALDESTDSQTFLGCLLDAGARVVKWLEIAVQNLQGLSQSPAAARSLSNSLLDRRWEEFAHCAAAADPASTVLTGWEAQHPLPIFLDPAKKNCVNAIDQSNGHAWRLCQDDQLLAHKQLPPYSTSLARYLYVRELGEQSAFVPITSDSPSSEYTKQLSEVASLSYCVPFNPGAGLMMVRMYSPVGFEQMLEVLGGDEFKGVRHGRAVLNWQSPRSRSGGDIQKGAVTNGRLLLDRHGRAGLIIEALHLKLRMLLDAAIAIRSWLAQTQTPLLNITPESFLVRLCEPGASLPQLWTARISLSNPGDAIALPVQATDTRYFARSNSAEISVYQPLKAAQAVRGSASMRIRQAIDVGGGTLFEGTLVTQERVNAARNDLLWIRTNLAGERIDLYSQLEAGAALASGEIRFRTVPQRLSQAAGQALRAAAGVPVDGVMFEVIPLLSSPCDLHALAVVAVRSLLVNPDNSLPLALDEALSLARQVATEHTETVPLAKRIAALLERDDCWMEAIGPQRLVQLEIAPVDALGLIPRELWCAVLAAIVRMFPGIGPDSICGDFSDAIAGGLHRVFDPAISDLEQLVLRTRSLILVDWRLNREIHSVIRQCVGALVGDS